MWGFYRLLLTEVHKEAVIATRHWRAKLTDLYGHLLATVLGSEGHLRSLAWGRRRMSDDRAFTILEMIVAMAIIMTLAAMSLPALADAIEVAYITQAIGDIRTLQTEITRFEVRMGQLPDSLNEVGIGDLLDPWGSPYQYLNFDNSQGQGQKRKDKFQIPLNSTYDLYSMGKDGTSVPPLTGSSSQDDVVRANDGAFIGLATGY